MIYVIHQKDLDHEDKKKSTIKYGLCTIDSLKTKRIIYARLWMVNHFKGRNSEAAAVSTLKVEPLYWEMFMCNKIVHSRALGDSLIYWMLCPLEIYIWKWPMEIIWVIGYIIIYEIL